MFPTQFTGASFTWERKKLGDVAKITPGGTPSKNISNYWYPKEIPWLSSGEINKEIIFSTDDMISKEGFNNSSAKWIKQDSVLIALAGQGKTRGKVAINRIPLTTNQSIAGIEPSNEVYYKFLYHQLTKDYLKLRLVSSGDGSRGGLNKKLLNDYAVNLSSIDEQHKLGILLSRIDNTLQLHEDYLQLLYDFRSFLLQKMFSINDTFPNLRFKQFNDKWKYKKLGEIADIISGGTPDTTKHDYWNGSINWYTPAEVGNKIFVSDSQRKITNIGLENSSAKILPVGTVLFTSRAGIGKTAILKEKGSTNQGFQSIVPKQKFLDSYFIFSMSNILKKYGESHGAGSTFLEISGKELAKANISLPSITEQKHISKALFKLDTIITLQKQKIDNLKKLKKFLLQNMFI